MCDGPIFNTLEHHHQHYATHVVFGQLVVEVVKKGSKRNTQKGGEVIHSYLSKELISNHNSMKENGGK